MIQLDKYAIKLEEPIPISWHDNASTITQRDYLNAIMQVKVEKDVRAALNRIDVREGEHHLDTWTVTGKGVYVGTWSKRLSKLLYKEHHIKLDPTTVSIISERIMTALTGTQENLIFMFSKEDWNAGEFGETTNSCWFNGAGYSHSRLGILSDPNGGAIKFFNPDYTNRARCWYYNIEGSIIIFNAYDRQGKLNILSMARLISVFYGLEYEKHSEVTIDTSYVNGRSIYAIGNPPIKRPIALDFALRAKKHLPAMHEDIILPIPSNSCCPHCGAEQDTITLPNGEKACNGCTYICQQSDCSNRNTYENSISTWDGTYICETCRDEHYRTCLECLYLVPSDNDECPHCTGRFTCYNCDEERSGEQYTDVNGNTICQSCMEEDYTECYHCENMVDNESYTYLESYERRVCDTCLNENYTRCGVCDTYAENSESVECRDSSYCRSCAEDRVITCEQCGGTEHVDYYSTVVASETDTEAMWCEDCTDQHATHCELCGETYADALNHDCSEDEDENQADD